MNKQIFKIIYGKKTLSDNSILYVRAEDFEIPHGEDYKIAIEELDKIQNQILKKNTFASIFLYKEISLWWFVYQTLIAHYKKEINFIHKFLELIHEKNPTSITVIHDFQYFELIKQICVNNKIEFIFSKSDYLKYKIRNRGKNLINKSRHKKIYQSKTQERLNIFLNNKKTIPILENKILFFVPTIYRRKIFDTKTKIFCDGEYIQQSIMNLLNIDDLVGIDVDYTFKGNSSILFDRLSDSIPWMPIEYILSKNFNIQTHEKFLQSYHELINSLEFQELFVYEGISLWKNIESTFREMEYESYIPFYLKLIDSFNERFLKEKPKAIFLPYETGPIALAIIAVCSKLRIKTIGIQHGYIYKHSPMYSFGSFIRENFESHYPIPDKTLLFGNYVKNLLIENGYPKDKLVVFGNPAFFNLEIIYDIIDRKKLLEQIGIDENKKIILFTTGKLQKYYTAHGKYDYDEQIWKTLLQNFANNKNYFIILKPHPQEQNVKAYEEILSKIPCSNAKILTHGIFELILISSLMISVFSSTMFDAMFFKKPVIRVKFKNEINHIFDSSDGLLNSSLDSLEQNISEIINDPEKLNNLLHGSAQMLKDHYGLPSENPQNILSKIIDE